jgi:hypothetical protein
MFTKNKQGSAFKFPIEYFSFLLLIYFTSFYYFFNFSRCIFKILIFIEYFYFIENLSRFNGKIVLCLNLKIMLYPRTN